MKNEEDNDKNVDKLRYLRTRLDSDPNNADLWIEYGDFVQENFVNPKEVVRAFQNASSLVPTSDLRLRLGSALVNSSQEVEGIAMIKQSLLENPRSHGYCILATCFLRTGDLQAAKEAAEQAIQLDSEFEEGYFLLGEAVSTFSRSDAIFHYRKAIELDAGYALAWQGLGRELAADDETLEEAIKALRKTIELDPEDGWAMAFLGNALWRNGQESEAGEWFKRATEVFHECVEMKRFLDQFQGNQAIEIEEDL